MKFLALVFAVLVLSGCPSDVIKPKPVEPKDTASCADACGKLNKLGCEEGKPLEDGTSCEKFCVDSQQSGHALRPSCIVEKVQKCADIQPVCFEK
jgi:hypothetical protein